MTPATSDERILKPPYTEFATVRPWSSNDGRFNAPVGNVPVYWRKLPGGEPATDQAGNLALAVCAPLAPNPIEVRSEITTADGLVYAVAATGGRSGGAAVVYVRAV